jgi:hypothetical protein
MNLTNNESRKISLGFAISVLVISILYIIVVTGWIISPSNFFLTSMEIISLLAGPTIVCLVAVICTIFISNARILSFVSVAFASCFAVLTSTNHFLYLTIFNKTVFKDNMLEDLFSLAKWPSIVMGIDYIAWGFFLGLALIFSAFTLKAVNKLYISIRSILIISGVLCITGLIGPLTGNIGLWYISVTGYAVGLPVVSALLINIFSNKN